MRTRAAIAAGALSLIALSAAAQPLPRTASGHPDLQGIWQVSNRAAYGLEDHVARYRMPAGLSVVDGGTLPYQDWAREKQRENFANRATADPLNRCFLPGTPRIMYLEWPFQIFQTDELVAITFEWQQTYRLIYTDGEPPLYGGIESWLGDSRGHWDGDTLVVDVTDFNDQTWLDASGNFHSAAMHVTERYTLVDPDTIDYVVTVEDPEVFTRPWTMRMQLHRQTGLKRVLEYQCQAEKEEANGDFERDVRTWYPAAAPPGNAPFDAAAARDLPLPEPTGEIRRLADGTPDISGYFMAESGGANYGLEQREREGLAPGSRGHVIDPPDGSLPYQSWARAEAEDRFEPYRGYDDPTAHCFVAGIPRSHYVPAPFRIMQSSGYVVMFYERMSWRQVRLDDDTHLPDDVRLWMGDSIGHWDGDTLVVDSANFNGKVWLNEAGDVMTHAERAIETYTPVGPDEIIYRATVTDPIAFTQPWTIEMPFRRENEELLEVACLEDNGDLEHLKDVRDEWRAEQSSKEEGSR